MLISMAANNLTLDEGNSHHNQSSTSFFSISPKKQSAELSLLTSKYNDEVVKDSPNRSTTASPALQITSSNSEDNNIISSVHQQTISKSPEQCTNSPTNDIIATEPSIMALNGDPQEPFTSCSYMEVDIDEPNKDQSELTDKLLEALTRLIPYKNSLAVKLLVNYSVDGDNSSGNCVVIDKTVYRGDQCHIDSTGNKSISPPASINKGLVMDLSLGTNEERVPVSATNHHEMPGSSNELINKSTNQQNQQLIELLECIKRINEVSTDASPVKPESDLSISKPVELPIIGQSTGENSLTNSIDTTNSIVNILRLIKPNQPTTSQIAMPSLAPTLLPFVSNNQQQQLFQQLQMMNALKVPIIGSLNSMSPVKDPNSIDNNVLLKQLAALIQNQPTNQTSLTPEVATAALTNNSLLLQTLATPSSSGSTLPTDFIIGQSSANTNQLPLTNPFTALISPANNNLPNIPTSTSSLTGINPSLFGAFTSEQLAALTASPFKNGTYQSTSMTTTTLGSQPSSTVNNNFASFNLGSATLLNLKDKQTGLDRLGIVPLTSQQYTLTNPSSTLATNTPSLLLGNAPIRTLSHLFQTPIQSPNLSSALLVNNNRSQLPTTNTTLTNKPSIVVTTTPAKQHSTSNANQLKFSPLNSNSGIKNNTKAHHHGSHNYALARRIVANNANRRFTCNQCRSSFLSLAELNRHTLDKHNTFKCTICSAHFTQRSNLQRHSLKHVGFKPFTCNLCRKEYYRKDHLVRHIEVTHPSHDPKTNITVHLTSSECLDYLDSLNSAPDLTDKPNDTGTGENAEIAGDSGVVIDNVADPQTGPIEHQTQVDTNNSVGQQGGLTLPNDTVGVNVPPVDVNDAAPVNGVEMKIESNSTPEPVQTSTTSNNL